MEIVSFSFILSKHSLMKIARCRRITFSWSRSGVDSAGLSWLPSGDFCTSHSYTSKKIYLGGMEWIQGVRATSRTALEAVHGERTTMCSSPPLHKWPNGLSLNVSFSFSYASSELGATPAIRLFVVSEVES